MIITALLGFFQSVLYATILFYIGKIFSNSRQLRNYLGLAKENEDENDFIQTSYWVENIGRVLKIVALLSMFISLVTTIMVLVGI